jgi:hypothetical protein
MVPLELRNGELAATRARWVSTREFTSIRSDCSCKTCTLRLPRLPLFWVPMKSSLHPRFYPFLSPSRRHTIRSRQRGWAFQGAVIMATANLGTCSGSSVVVLSAVVTLGSATDRRGMRDVCFPDAIVRSCSSPWISGRNSLQP